MPCPQDGKTLSANAVVSLCDTVFTCGHPQWLHTEQHRQLSTQFMYVTIKRRSVDIMRSLVKSICVLLAGGIVLLSAACQESPPGSINAINIATGGTSGIYYPLGTALARVYGETLPDAKIFVHSTQASTENLDLLQSGRVEIAFTLGDVLSDAWRGEQEAGFRVPLDRLRVIAGMYPGYIHIVARADAGIRTLADLRNKRVSVGALKSGTERNTRKIIRAAGLSYGEFARVEYLPFGETVELMKQGQLDVTLQSVGLGAASLRELASAVDVVFVPIPQDIVRRVNDPAYQPGIIPANTYRGQTRAVRTAAIQNFLVTRKDMPTEVIHKLTKAMFENLNQLTTAHAAALSIRLDQAAANPPAPIHPGAEMYYREKQVIQ
jgi:uncharacterized protein